MKNNIKKENRLNFAFVFLAWILFTVFFLPSVFAAADVAYIYKNPRLIDENVLQAFRELNASVDFINDENVRLVNLGQYKLIFISKERVRNTARYIDLSRYNAMIMNTYYGFQFGLTDNDGISSFTANSPLSVVRNGQIVPVYTTARVGANYLSYYYLSTQNKPRGFVSVAVPFTGDGTMPPYLGDVISFGNKSTLLRNGKTLQQKWCFFGIAESSYWTPQAKQMFKDCAMSAFNIVCSSNNECNDRDGYTEDVCINPGMLNSSCTHRPITCLSESDCGTDRFIGDQFCSAINSSEIARVYQNFTCNNPGTSLSFCSDTNTSVIIEQCSDICINGECVNITCRSDIECNDSNLYTQDTCLQPGTINSSCNYRNITCLSEIDCGQNGFIGDPFCSQDDIYRIYTNYTCDNAGTPQSFCSSSNITLLVEQCTEFCTDGMCRTNITCSTNNECNDNDSHTTDLCINPGTNQSYCTHEPIVCLNNNECGMNAFVGQPFCSQGDVYRNFRNFQCINPGTSQSYCSSNTTIFLLELCSDACIDGACVDVRCYSNDDCDDDNNYTEDFCILPGTPEAFCQYGNIACLQDNDCGADRFIGELICIENNVSRGFLDYRCINGGTISSYCSTFLSPITMEMCQYACSNGNCVRCNNNNECDDGDIYTQDTCIFSGTPESYCLYDHIECFENIECGVNSFVGVPYCSEDTVYQDYRIFQCINEGTPGSYCTSTLIQTLIQQCAEDGCENGFCISGGHDIVLSNLQFDSGSQLYNQYAQNNILVGNRNYNVLIDVFNSGDFSEDVFFDGIVRQGIFTAKTFNHARLSNFSARTLRTNYGSNVLFNLSSGEYNVSVLATIGNIDSTPLNNLVEESILIVDCVSNNDCGQSEICQNPGTLNSICTTERNITCSQDSDCGISGYTGELFCSQDDVYRIYQNFACINPGTSQSYCASMNSTQLIQNCSDQCVNGQCQEIICSNDSECDDGNQYTSDQCLNPGTNQSLCSYQNITCLSDNDCTDSTNEFCSAQGEACTISEFGMCNLQGTPQSYCSLIPGNLSCMPCANGCLNGTCLQQAPESFAFWGNGLGQIIFNSEINDRVALGLNYSELGGRNVSFIVYDLANSQIVAGPFKQEGFIPPENDRTWTTWVLPQSLAGRTLYFNATIDGTALTFRSNTLFVRVYANNSSPHAEIVRPISYLLGNIYRTGEAIYFKQNSFDSDDLINSTWYFGDGTSLDMNSTEIHLSNAEDINLPTHTYVTGGFKTIRLKVTDERNLVDWDQTVIYVMDNQETRGKAFFGNGLGQEIQKAEIGDRVALGFNSEEINGRNVIFTIYNLRTGRSVGGPFYQEGSLPGGNNVWATWRIPATMAGERLSFVANIQGVVGWPMYSNIINVTAPESNARPFAEIINPLSGRSYQSGIQIRFQQNTFDEDDLVSAVWDFGDGIMYSMNSTQIKMSEAEEINAPLHAYLSAGAKNIILTITDERGLQYSTNTTIFIVNTLDKKSILF